MNRKKWSVVEAMCIIRAQTRKEKADTEWYLNLIRIMDALGMLIKGACVEFSELHSTGLSRKGGGK